MRNLNKVWKIGFAFMALTLFLVQSCNKADQNLSPEIDNVLSVASMDWEIVNPSDVPDPCKQVCLVAGQHMNVGSVDVGVDGSDIVVTYNIFEEGVYLMEVHLDVFTDEEAFANSKKVNGGGANPGQFAFHKYFSEEDMVTSFSVKVPGEYFNYEDCVFIASHAALSNGETAWGGICNESDKGVTLVNALQFPGKNWSVYFDFCSDDCVSPIDFTYAWEDKQNTGNDADYNDLVVQSDVMKYSDQLVIDFFATARGAAYDHAFKIKVPMQGVTSISGDQGVTNDGTFYYITIFPSTKVALPEFVGGFSANTFNSDVSCDPTASAQVILNIDGAFVYDENKPFEPFITVWPSGIAGDGANYDLYVYEVSGSGTWTDGEVTYPNGIIIPENWHWPLERVRIWNPYPEFDDGTLPDLPTGWAENLVNPGQVWSCE